MNQSKLYPRLAVEEKERFHLVEELAEVFSDKDSASALLLRAGFPRRHIPNTADSLVFWTLVAEKVQNGAYGGKISDIAKLAAADYPHNRIFSQYAVDAGADSQGSPVKTSSQSSGSAFVIVIDDVRKTFVISITFFFDSNGELAPTCEGSDLRQHNDLLHVIVGWPNDEGDYSIIIKIHDFYADGQYWTVEASGHDEAWERRDDYCYLNLRDTGGGEMRVQIRARSGSESRDAHFFLRMDPMGSR